MSRLTSKSVDNDDPYGSSAFGGTMVPYQQQPYGGYGMMAGPSDSLGRKLCDFGGGAPSAGGFNV